MNRWDGTDWWFAALVTTTTLGALTYAAVLAAEIAHITQETP